MSANDESIFGLPCRPRVGDASQTAILGALTLGILTGGLGAALIGGVAAAAIANQKQPLEMAIREYFKRLNLEVVFYYPAPRAVKVTFQYGTSEYWTVESVMPDSLRLSAEDAADWLYGNLIKVELPNVLQNLYLTS